jgi:tripartite-type tricarboxylate transporter receptor subunit TctC
MDMQSKKRVVLLGFLVILSVLAAVGSGGAADRFPSREIIIVVPFPAGGSQDFGARILAEYMNLTKDLGMNVIVENRPEAGAVKGIVDVYKAKPDGYLLLSTLFPSFAQKEVVYKAPYKILDMTYLAAFNKSDQFLVVNSTSPYKTFKDLVEASQKKPLNCGISVVGSLSHLTALVIKKEAGVHFEVVPFKGGASNVMALLGNNVDMTVADDTIIAMQGDKLRTLGIANDKRSPNFPNVPTFKELGFNVPVMNSLQGITGPPGLPEDVVRTLSNVLNKAIHNPTFIKRTIDSSSIPIYMNGADFKAAARSSYTLIDEFKDIFPKE